MASLAEIRTTLKDTIEAAVSDLQVYEKAPEQVNLPAAVVLPTQTDFVQAFGRGLDVYEFDVLVLVSRRDDDLAQTDLDEYVNGFGAKSIRQAIFAARATLAALGIDAFVVGMSDYGAQFNVGDIDHVGARLRVRVTTSGTA
jgi:hypothetical protein